jgi:hypothetical protein
MVIYSYIGDSDGAYCAGAEGSEAKSKEKHGECDPMPETITSPYV